jgi:hypothetical protein
MADTGMSAIKQPPTAAAQHADLAHLVDLVVLVLLGGQVGMLMNQLPLPCFAGRDRIS